MYEKESKDKNIDDPSMQNKISDRYRGDPMCPNGKSFIIFTADL